MRVLLACDWFLKYAINQSVGLAGQGADVMLVCRSHSLEFGGDTAERTIVLDKARAAGVVVTEIPARISNPTALPALRRIRRLIFGFSPDVVHVHERVDPRVAFLLPHRCPIVLTIHDPVPHDGQPRQGMYQQWFWSAHSRFWQTTAAAVVVHSGALRRDLLAGVQAKTVVIPHGQEVRTRPLQPPKTPTVVFFGRLAPYKGLEILAEAMELVWKQRPDVSLYVAGEGDARFGLNDRRVHVDRRYVPEEELVELFRTGSVAVLPYTQASQSGVASLAVGFGVPVIVAGVGGLPDLALDDSYVFPPGNADALACVINNHLDDGPEVRRRVLHEIASPRSWEAVAQRSLQLYNRLR